MTPETATTPTATSARTELLGVTLDRLDLDATVGRCMSAVERHEGLWQVSINALKLDLCERDPEFAATIGRAGLSSPDGVPVVWASRLLGSPLPGRVNGTDLMERLLEESSKRHLSVFVLGARSEVLAQATEVIRDRYPGIDRLTTQDGYFSRDREQEIASAIAGFRPDVLLVAMPSPYKEQFLARHVAELDCGVAIGVGGSIDVLTGERRRAPRWMQRSGLEWFFRLLQEPRRLWRRYAVGNSRLVLLTLRELFAR